MIARIWHGTVRLSDSERYFDYLNKTGIPDYQHTEGNRGVTILRRHEGDTAHFLLITFWDSEEAIRRFAGPDMNVARYYPEDTEFLLELEPTVVHYEVLAST